MMFDVESSRLIHIVVPTYSHFLFIYFLRVVYFNIEFRYRIEGGKEEAN